MSGHDNLLLQQFTAELPSDLACMPPPPDFITEDDLSVVLNPAAIHSPLGSRESTSSSIDSDAGFASGCDFPDQISSDFNINGSFESDGTAFFNQLANFPPSPSNSDDSVPATTTSPTVPVATNVVNLTDLANVKIPIPKIAKPQIMTPVPTKTTAVKKEPIILTSEQFAQLTSSGVLKVQTSGPTTTPQPAIGVKQEVK